MSIRVLIAEDQELVRSGLRMMLEAEPEIVVVGEARDGLQAIELTMTWGPDVILMDVRMPRLDGIETIRRLNGLGLQPTPHVLVVTTFGDDASLFEALRAGASGFILKDASPEELANAVKVVARGDCLLDPKLTRSLVEEFARGSHSNGDPTLYEQLTNRERDVLRHIAWGLSNRQIAKELVVAETTVKTHVAHIFSKLDVHDRAQAVVVAYESGLVEPRAPKGR